jgi:hypothetical protein
VCGGVAQLVRVSACHAEGRGFEPRRSRHFLIENGPVKNNSQLAGVFSQPSLLSSHCANFPVFPQRIFL